MAEAPDNGEKTEAPSAKRRQEAADKGDVRQSRELGTALILIAGAGWLSLAGPWFASAMRQMLASALTIGRADVVGFDPWTRVVHLAGAPLLPLATLFGATILASVAGPGLLGSLGFRANAFAFRPGKLDPLAGIGRVFGTQGLIELGKSLAKVVLIGGIGGWLVATRMPAIMGLAAVDPDRAASATGGLFVTIVLWMAATLGVVGMIDAPVQFIRRTARLRMTKAEVKQEHKESEGSPENKNMARQRRHDILNGSARRAVSEATVILTNPTHFAVALRYRPETDAVPMVVARGRGETALAIKALARESDLPQLEYPQLTRAIYFTTRAGQPISADLYLAVATVLAFVFNLDRAMAEGVRQPEVAVPPAKAFDENGRRSDRGR